jgi:tryptophanyl-tRNA synthetase
MGYTIKNNIMNITTMKTKLWNVKSSFENGDINIEEYKKQLSENISTLISGFNENDLEEFADSFFNM